LLSPFYTPFYEMLFFCFLFVFFRNFDWSALFYSPFVKCSPCEMQQAIREILYNGVEYPDIHVLANDCRPILQLGMVGTME
jgi:hypothetical protein